MRRLTLGIEDRKLNPGEVRAKPCAPHDVLNLERLPLLVDGCTSFDFHDPGSASDASVDHLIHAEPDQRAAVSQDLRPRLATNRRIDRKHPVCHKPKDPTIQGICRGGHLAGRPPCEERCVTILSGFDRYLSS